MLMNINKCTFFVFLSLSFIREKQRQRVDSDYKRALRYTFKFGLINNEMKYSDEVQGLYLDHDTNLPLMIIYSR